MKSIFNIFFIKLKIIYFVFTKKEIYFAAINNRVINKSGAVRFCITKDSKSNNPFLLTISSDVDTISEKLNENDNIKIFID